MNFNEKLQIEKVRNLNPVVLAFVGDAVYSLYVRKKLVAESDCKTGELNSQSAKIVCAAAQAERAAQISSKFTEEENAVFHRARNAKKNTRAKHASVADYNASTGFEAVLGYLYLKGDFDRLDELLVTEDN